MSSEGNGNPVLAIAGILMLVAMAAACVLESVFADKIQPAADAISGAAGMISGETGQEVTDLTGLGANNPNQPGMKGLGFIAVPDSELVYGPGSADFNIAAFIQQHGGYLNQYGEEVDGQWLTGAQIIERIALDYSVNPRLLLAILEYQSGWVTQASAMNTDYPIGIADPNRIGLYRQLAFAANSLNRGYYLWRVNAIKTWATADGGEMPAVLSINAGTAGLQHLMSDVYGQDRFVDSVNDGGVYATYSALFGEPFSRAAEPMLPEGLTQPAMQLPFEPGALWSFTGGPHGGWDSGSGWAAIDFAPPGEALGCVSSDAWVTAVADGVIVRAGNGAVVQDLDGDGYEQTGWTILYMHVETRDRVASGTQVKAGDRIGHPSCEGGVSTGTHLHLARRYNGEWIPADNDLPFNLDGWISSGDGIQYNGYLRKNGMVVEARTGRYPENQIYR